MKTQNAGGEMVLCISTLDQGHAMLRELNRLGCRVVLLTTEALRDTAWPRETLEDFQTMPGGMTQQQIANTVTYLARTRRFGRIFPLAAADMWTVAALREYMRIPGMGSTTTRNFYDRLAMRARADHLGIRTPAFAAVLNYDELRAYMENVPAPWLLRPRSVVSDVEVRRLSDAEAVWRTLEELGDAQSDFLLEQEISGDIFSVAGIVAEGEVAFAAPHSPISVPEELGRELKAIQARLLPSLGMVRGVYQTKFLRSHASGKLYFLEAVAEPGHAASGPDDVNFWAEWARVEVAALRGEKYRLLHLPD